MTLRSDQWYAGGDRNAFLRLTPCNADLDEVVRAGKQGVYQAGGIPLTLPVVSLGETFVRPTAMLWCNMTAMAMEEMFRANPVDGLVGVSGPGVARESH